MPRKLDRHVWRTDDGRHVPPGHQDAAFLAYPAGDEVPDAVLGELGDVPAAKRGRRPADKADKAPVADKGGLTIDRRAGEGDRA